MRSEGCDPCLKVSASGIGIWDGLLCVQDAVGRLTFLSLPEGW